MLLQLLLLHIPASSCLLLPTPEEEKEEAGTMLPLHQLKLKIDCSLSVTYCESCWDKDVSGSYELLKNFSLFLHISSFGFFPPGSSELRRPLSGTTDNRMPLSTINCCPSLCHVLISFIPQCPRCAPELALLLEHFIWCMKDDVICGLFPVHYSRLYWIVLGSPGG